MPVEDSNDIESSNTLLFPDDKTVIRWSPDSIVPLNTSAEPTDYNVDIYLYVLDLMSEDFSMIEIIASNIPNTGMFEITLPLVDLPDNFTSGRIGVSLSEQFPSRSTRNAIPNSVRTLLIRACKCALIYLGVSLTARALCAAWRLTEPDNIGQTILDRLPPCPPSKDEAEKDPNFRDESFALSFFHPDASSCFRQVKITRYVHKYCL